MILQELIDSRLQVILSRLGKKVTNAALFREELGADCPSDEAILAEDAAYQAEQAAAALVVSESKQKEAQYSAWVAQGFDTGLGFKMAVSKDDQTAMSNLMTGLKNKAPSNDSIWTIKDKDGVKHDITYSQFKDLADDYFDHVYGAWKQS